VILLEEKAVRVYEFSGSKGEGVLVPTSGAFVNTQSFIAGYKIPYIVQYELQTVFYLKVK